MIELNEDTSSDSPLVAIMVDAISHIRPVGGGRTRLWMKTGEKITVKESYVQVKKAIRDEKA